MYGKELIYDEKPAREAVAIGLSLAVIGFAGKFILKRTPISLKSLFLMNISTKYYKGGFESTMTKSEAYLILGISPSSNRSRIKEAHKRIMLLNHPDKGGSPYLAAKINEARNCIKRIKP